MEISNLDLHDARLLAVSVDVPNRSVSIKVDAYLPDHPSRVLLHLCFRGVADFSCCADLINLTDNARSGNVNYWKPVPGGGKSFLYLNDGCIVVVSDEVEVVL
jgi:hypothetical protein